MVKCKIRMSERGNTKVGPGRRETRTQRVDHWTRKKNLVAVRSHSEKPTRTLGDRHDAGIKEEQLSFSKQLNYAPKYQAY